MSDKVLWINIVFALTAVGGQLFESWFFELRARLSFLSFLFLSFLFLSIQGERSSSGRRAVVERSSNFRL